MGKRTVLVMRKKKKSPLFQLINSKVFLCHSALHNAKIASYSLKGWKCCNSSYI